MQMHRLGKDLFPDLVKFSKHHIKSKDIDPVYPVLAYLQRKMDEETALWHSTLYVAWYNIASGVSAFTLNPEFPPKKLKIFQQWPTATERRGHRDWTKLLEHLSHYVQLAREMGSQRNLLTGSGIGAVYGPSDWERVFNRLQVIYGNGRWAAYKMCEILRRVHGWPIQAPDIGNRFSSGPRAGLALFYTPPEKQNEAAIDKLDRQAADLRTRLTDKGLKVDFEELETILCDFHSLHQGRYYVGHDIDQMYDQLKEAEEKKWKGWEATKRVWLARLKTLPHHYLAELNGWDGVQKKRKKSYQLKGKIVIRKESS